MPRNEIGNLTEDEVSTIVHALRVAADCFDEDRKEALETKMFGSYRRLADQFAKQARESRALADEIENARAVRVLTEAA